MPKSLPKYLSAEPRPNGEIRYKVRMKCWDGIARRWEVGTNKTRAIAQLDSLVRMNLYKEDFDILDRPDNADKITTFADALEQWVPTYVAQNGNASQGRYLQNTIFPRLAEFFVGPLKQITTSRIRDYVAYRRATIKTSGKGKGKPPADGPINNELTFLNVMVKDLADRGHITKAPKIEYLALDNERDREPSRLEYRRLMQALAPVAKPLLTLLWELGGRIGEWVQKNEESKIIEWSQIDLETRVIWLQADQTKTKKKRAVPISDIAYATLLTISGPRTGFVFKNEDGTPKTYGWWRYHINKARKQTDTFDLVTHDFRAGLICRLVRQGISFKRISRITGHTNLENFARYDRPTLDDLRSVVNGTHATAETAVAEIARLQSLITNLEIKIDHLEGENARLNGSDPDRQVAVNE